MSENFRLWFKRLRSDIRICMLIPMEAVMGLPIEIYPGKAYLIPFYRSDTALRTCYPPSAYICISYPDARILRFQDLSRDFDIEDHDKKCSIRAVTELSSSFDYYNYLKKRIGDLSAFDQDPDEMLMKCIAYYYEGMSYYYSMLIHEKNKYLERNRNE